MRQRSRTHKKLSALEDPGSQGSAFRISRRDFVISLLFGSALLRSHSEAAPQSREKPASDPLLLVSHNASLGQIVVADQPDHIGITSDYWRLDRTQTTLFAATYLQEKISKISGVSLPIIPASRARRDCALVLVGRSPLTDFVETERQNLPVEGFIIKRHLNRLAIVGEVAEIDGTSDHRAVDRGTFWGVLELLSREWDVRQYFPGDLGLAASSQERLVVATRLVKGAPHFPMRTGAFSLGLEQAIPATRSGNTTEFWSSHSCNDWYRYVPTRPELFAVDAAGGQSLDPSSPGTNRCNHLCYSTSETLEVELQRIDRFYVDHESLWEKGVEPSQKYVRLFPKDLENIYHCCCPLCRPRWNPCDSDSILSPIIFSYAKRVADTLARRYPGKRLAVGAYAGFLFPPPNLQIPDNVDVIICTVKGNMLLANPAYYEYNKGLIEAWSASLGQDPKRLFVWEYLVYPDCLAPAFYPHILKEWIQFLRGKVSGGFCNGWNPNKNPLHYRFSILNAWLWHKLLWDPDADVDNCIDAFCHDMFGPAERPMRSLFELSIASWEGAPWEKHIAAGAVSHVSNAFLYNEIFPPDIISKMEECLDSAEAASRATGVCNKRVMFFGEAFREFFRRSNDPATDRS